MKISLEWLRDFLPQVPTAGEAADALTHGGLPVEVIEQVGDDTVIDVEVTSNRSDCLSHRGVARELAALLNLQLQPLAETVITEAPAATPLRVAIDATELCPHYTARIVGGVKIGPSPDWMIRRLTAIGVRPVNNVVDCTNYVMFELGQPLHAFDFDRIDGGEIRVRTAASGESLISLDGHERKLTGDMLVVADAHRPVALAGVMGGRDSEVTEATTTILLESARFDPLVVRKAARSLSMKSDASYRYERGIDPNLPAIASQRAVELIIQTAGGEVFGNLVQARKLPAADRRIILRAARLKKVLGVEFAPVVVGNALTRLRLTPTAVDGGWAVTPPSSRLDLNAEIDLVEEVARIVGYQNIPIRDEIAIRVTPADERLKTIDKIRRSLAAGGFSEAITLSFVSDSMAAFFTQPGDTLLRTSLAVRKADAQLRPSLLPGLLEAVRRNESLGTPDARLFEIGSTFWSDSQGTSQERRRVSWVGGDFPAVRGALESLLEMLDPTKRMRIDAVDRKGFAAAGRVTWGGTVVGTIGTVEKSILAVLGLRGVPAAGEIDLPALLDGTRHAVLLKPLPRFPAVQRDLSLVVQESTAYSTLTDAVEACGLPDLEALKYVTTYRGKPLEKGTKSVTLQLAFRGDHQTLTTTGVDAAVKTAVEALAGVGAQVRS